MLDVTGGTPRMSFQLTEVTTEMYASGFAVLGGAWHGPGVAPVSLL